MTKQDTYQLMAVLHALYPDSFRGMSDTAAQLRVSLWQEAFADDPGAVVIAAAKAFASTDTKGFMPTPGQIKEQILAIQKTEEMTEQEAWDLVLKALKNSNYCAAEEFKKLPEPVQKAVGSHNMLKQWAGYDVNKELAFVAADFKKSFRAIAAKEHDQKKLPAAVKEIAGGNEQKRLEA